MTQLKPHVIDKKQKMLELVSKSGSVCGGGTKLTFHINDPLPQLEK